MRAHLGQRHLGLAAAPVDRVLHAQRCRRRRRVCKRDKAKAARLAAHAVLHDVCGLHHAILAKVLPQRLLTASVAWRDGLVRQCSAGGGGRETALQRRQRCSRCRVRSGCAVHAARNNSPNVRSLLARGAPSERRGRRRQLGPKRCSTHGPAACPPPPPRARACTATAAETNTATDPFPISARPAPCLPGQAQHRELARRLARQLRHGTAARGGAAIERQHLALLLLLLQAAAVGAAAGE
jgi:hypothetical protein